MSSTKTSVEQAFSDIQTEVDTIKDEVTTNLQIESSRGNVFKNNEVSTVLSVVIYRGSQVITDLSTLKTEMGASAQLQWSTLGYDSNSYVSIPSSDPRIENGGFTLNLGPSDVDTKATFKCALNI